MMDFLDDYGCVLILIAVAGLGYAGWQYGPTLLVKIDEAWNDTEAPVSADDETQAVNDEPLPDGRGTEPDTSAPLPEHVGLIEHGDVRFVLGVPKECSQPAGESAPPLVVALVIENTAYRNLVLQDADFDWDLALAGGEHAGGEPKAAAKKSAAVPAKTLGPGERWTGYAALPMPAPAQWRDSALQVNWSVRYRGQPVGDVSARTRLVKNR